MTNFGGSYHDSESREKSNTGYVAPFVGDDVEERAARALDVAFTFGQFDGSHHKMWVIDQIARILTGEKYDEFIIAHNDGEDGPETYEWDDGIAP